MLCMNTLEGVIIKCKYGLEIKTLMQLIGDGLLLLKDLSYLQDEKSAYTTQELLEMIFCNSNKWCGAIMYLDFFVPQLLGYVTVIIVKTVHQLLTKKRGLLDSEDSVD